jgi:hypothetical protein
MPTQRWSSIHATEELEGKEKEKRYPLCFGFFDKIDDAVIDAILKV